MTDGRGEGAAAPRYRIEDLLRIMERLRDPEHGCPWDLKQDFASIVPSTLEECYELAAAIEAGDFGHVEDELGDVLFQVIFYARLGEERNLFSFASVVDGLAGKLLRRHRHVFRDGNIEGIVDDRSDAASVGQRWEAIKAAERAGRAQHGVLDDVPVCLPALPRAQKLQKRAARIGFDWADREAVLRKFDEEYDELREALATGDADAIEDELGDLLFTVVNLARHEKLDAEAALRRASVKFERRFHAMERFAADAGDDLGAKGAAALDELWERAKTDERGEAD